MIRSVLILLIAAGSFLFRSSFAHAGHSQKYIAEAYFEKHHSLIDSEFNDFVQNEVPLGLCKVLQDRNFIVPKLSHLQRELIGEGSHRSLSSSISFMLDQELKSEFTEQDREVIIVEKLPSGVFADPFELQHLVQRGVFSDAVAFGDTNLELPSFRSNRSVVEIHMSVKSQAFSKVENDSEVSVRVPLHARYPPLGVGSSKIEFGLPDIFICCSSKESSYNSSCLSFPQDHIDGFKSSPIVWDIPCGTKEHAQVVSIVTFSVAVVAALLIILASICYSDSTGLKNKTFVT